MDSNNKFSNNFLSLQLQLKTLLEDAGGDELMPFLDALATMNRSEQRTVLKIMTKTIETLRENGPRLETEGDTALKAFEDNLFEDLILAINAQTTIHRRIEVLPGGKDKPSKSEPISLDAVRRKKRESELVN